MYTKTFIKPLGERSYLVKLSLDEASDELTATLISATSGAFYKAVVNSSKAYFNQIEPHRCSVDRVNPRCVILITSPHQMTCNEVVLSPEQKQANRLSYIQWVIAKPNPAIRTSNTEQSEGTSKQDNFITWDLDSSQGNIGLEDNRKCIKFKEDGLYMIGYNLDLLPVGSLVSVWIKLRTSLPSRSGHREACFTSVVTTRTMVANQVIVQVNAGDEARVELYAGKIVMDENPRTFWATKL